MVFAFLPCLNLPCLSESPRHTGTRPDDFSLLELCWWSVAQILHVLLVIPSVCGSIWLHPIPNTLTHQSSINLKLWKKAGMSNQSRVQHQPSHSPFTCPRADDHRGSWRLVRSVYLDPACADGPMRPRQIYKKGLVAYAV